MIIPSLYVLAGLLACFWFTRVRIERPSLTLSPGQMAFSPESSSVSAVTISEHTYSSPSTSQIYVIDSWMNLSAPVIFILFVVFNHFIASWGYSVDMAMMNMAHVCVGLAFLLGVWISALMNRIVEHYLFYLALIMLALSL